MSLTWHRDPQPTWDADRQRIIGGAPSGAFALDRYPPTGALPGEWWHVEEEGRVVGFGWMDVVWGDAEILLAVDTQRQQAGVGKFILDHLETEAKARGLRRMYNKVRAEAVDRAATTVWLLRHGFRRVHDSDELERPVA